MCRFLAYRGAPVILDELLFQPENSLIHQSFHALERRDPVNGDGFGVGWYAPEVHREPARFLSIRPAWNHRNLRSLAPRIRSGAVFAHVRAASEGTVIEPNCHPFRYRSFLMMHNGFIGDFRAVKRALRNRLSDETYGWIEGQTDSEHFFALFLDRLLEKKREGHDHHDVVDALRRAIGDLKAILAEAGSIEHFYLNLAVTNGKCIVASRYDTNVYVESPTLYHSEGGRYRCFDGVCRMTPAADPAERAVLVVSEKLTPIESDWHVVPEEHFVVVTEDLDVSVVPVEV
jgi:predicted glutamine amidotransferase